MKFKNIEDLTAAEVNRLVATRILKEPWDPANDYSGDWAVGGPVVEKYLIGSEGKSAWIWYENKNYGMVGNSQLDACMKTLLFSRYYSGWVGDGYAEPNNGDIV